MAIFKEISTHTVWAFVLMAVIFALSFPLWHLSERELFWDEGIYATAEQEAVSFPPVITAHGVVQPEVYPLFLLFTRAVTKCGTSAEFALRFVSVFSLLVLTFLVAYSCYSTDGPLAAVAGATAMMSTLLVAEKTPEGYPQMLTALILYSGWLLWFYLGLGRGHWDLAWISNGLFAGLAFYNAGPTGLACFLIPLFLQRRPMTIWNKMRHPGFIAAILIVVTAIFLWWVPYWNEDTYIMPKENYQFTFSFGKYLTHVICSPFIAFFRLLPWSLFLWAPFCAALIPLDRNPLFSRFHRILFISLLVMISLNPTSKARDFLYLAPVASTMIGLNYWIVVRRYGYRFLAAFRVLGWLLILATLLAAAFYIFPLSWFFLFLQFFETKPVFPHDLPGIEIIINVIEIAAAFAAAVAAVWLCRKKTGPVWLVYLLLFGSMLILFWTVVNVRRAENHAKKEFAESFVIKLENDLKSSAESEGGSQKNDKIILYKDSMISGLYPECYYIGYPIRTVELTQEIPNGGDIVYVISRGIPSIPTRTWLKLNEYDYKGKKLFLYRGQLRKEDYDDRFDY